VSFWWVNHKQTFKVEFEEGYIWSPQENRNGSRNESYINLTRTSIGDTIFSYAAGKIQAVGRITDPCKVEQRPELFGATGSQWNEKGWLVRVQWTPLSIPFSPKNHLATITPLLPAKHSPIQANGNGNQVVYLAALSDKLGNVLLSLINQSNDVIFDQLEMIDRNLDDKALEKQVLHNQITVTQRQQLIQARIGQGQFRQNVEGIESKCRITGVKDKRLLIASHIKPWKVSTNDERLDGHNGLLLSPHIDRLFDKGFISFTDKGGLLICTQKILPVLEMWHIDSNQSVGSFTAEQKRYLEYHQKEVFKG
jgi:hypothetical protein